jgi:hydroxymethylglutaryl-CoA lyase
VDPSRLPPRVSIREVSPRDGLQNTPELVSTEDKVRLVDDLARTGLARLEVGSFVHPDVVPQLADTDEVLRRVSVPDGVEITALVPNERGLDRALAQAERLRQITVFVSASESHNQANVNRSVEETMVVLERMIPRIVDAGLRAGAVTSTAFGCPYEGIVDPGRAFELQRRLAAVGATELGFGDTTGMANPVQVSGFFARAFEELPADAELTAHFHNTRGQGLANVLAALEAGVTSFESSVGELGGCPVPVGATGNIASDDLVSMLHEMGVQTGIDLDRLIACGHGYESALGRPLSSHVMVAGPVAWAPAALDESRECHRGTDQRRER